MKTKVETMDFRPFIRKLRKHLGPGVRKDYASVAGGVRIAIYNFLCKPSGGLHIELEIQLWGDGNHRVSHWIYEGKRRSHMNTAPSDFKTLEGMIKAIEYERTRREKLMDQNCGPDFK